jgi:hypothetical protein
MGLMSWRDRPQRYQAILVSIQGEIEIRTLYLHRACLTFRWHFLRLGPIKDTVTMG